MRIWGVARAAGTILLGLGVIVALSLLMTDESVHAILDGWGNLLAIVSMPW